MSRTTATANAADSPSTVMGDALEHAPRPQSASRRPQRRSDMLVYLACAALVLGTWQLSRLELFTAKSDTGYWLGVTGGVLMLLLFAYPLRKRVPALARLGKAKHWFMVHMVLGIGGPVVILAHCAFSIGSLNAGVALTSMVVVALSGIMGRFIYLRIHRGLGGEVESFEALHKRLGFNAEAVRSQLHFAPLAEARLRALERHAGKPGDTWGEHLARVFVLPLTLMNERRLCRQEIDQALAAVAQARGWDAATQRQRSRRARRLVRHYASAVLRVAQLAAYTRLFSLWHVLHVPFVVVMVVCAIAHIVAVHAY